MAGGQEGGLPPCAAARRAGPVGFRGGGATPGATPSRPLPAAQLPEGAPAAVLLAKTSASEIFNENGHFLSHFLVKPATNQAFAGLGAHNEPDGF